MTNSDVDDKQCQLYNNKNILLEYNDLKRLLTRFDIEEGINDINVYRMSFVNKSYVTRKNDNIITGNKNCPSDCLPLQEMSNERLEFLGDSILNTCVANYLFERYPTMNEGFLTNMRTKLVNGVMLAKLSKLVGLDKYVIISKQLEEAGARINKNILEDTFESFIASIYLDFNKSRIKNGFEIASKWIISVIEEFVDFSELIKSNSNSKDLLLKYCQHNFHWQPKFYEIDVSDSKTKRIHTVCVKDNENNVIGIGKGFNRKYAEIDAAEKALKYYGES